MITIRIQLLGETTLGSINDIISKALTDGEISEVEFEKVLKEVSRYRTLKQEIRQKTKKVIDSITQEQREQLLAQGRQEGKNELIKKVFDSSTSAKATAPPGF